jgi:hypothetical protein
MARVELAVPAWKAVTARADTRSENDLVYRLTPRHLPAVGPRVRPGLVGWSLFWSTGVEPGPRIIKSNLSLSFPANY